MYSFTTKLGISSTNHYPHLCPFSLALEFVPLTIRFYHLSCTVTQKYIVSLPCGLIFRIVLPFYQINIGLSNTFMIQNCFNLKDTGWIKLFLFLLLLPLKFSVRLLILVVFFFGRGRNTDLRIRRSCASTSFLSCSLSSFSWSFAASSICFRQSLWLLTKF